MAVAKGIGGALRESEESEKELVPASAVQGDEISVFVLATAILRGRRLVVICTAGAVAVSLVLALLKERTYSSSFSFVPQGATESAAGGLAGLAGQFGVSIGGAGAVGQSPQFYADLLMTRAVLEPIVLDSVSPAAPDSARVPLPTFLGVEGSDSALVMERSLRALRGRVISTSVATRTTGVISVNVSTVSPHASLQIAESLLEGVNDFNLSARQSQAREERMFTEERLREARMMLQASEDELERFLKSNRQFANSPELALSRDRLERAVALRQQVTVGLAQQLEEVRIREVRDTPVITVIERPSVAASPDARGRVKLMVLGTLLGAFVGTLVVLMRVLLSIARQREPVSNLQALSSEWRSARRKL